MTHRTLPIPAADDQPGCAGARTQIILFGARSLGVVRRRGRFAQKTMWLILDTAADGSRRVCGLGTGIGSIRFVSLATRGTPVDHRLRRRAVGA